MAQPIWKFRDLDWHVVHFICTTAAYQPRDGSKIPGVFLAGEFCGWHESEWIQMKCAVHQPISLTQPTHSGDASAIDVAECVESLDTSCCGDQCIKWHTSVRLMEGAYQYKFIVNGQWICDDRNPHRGGEFDNSVMYVSCDPPNGCGGIVPISKEPHTLYRQYDPPDSEFQVRYPAVPDSCACRGLLSRPVFVYLPKEYVDLERTVTYPVLYVLDGQEAFSTPAWDDNPMTGGWWLDKQADMLVHDGATRPFIIVAIPSGDFVSIAPIRKREYCPENLRDTRNHFFCQYLLQSVVPFIDLQFPTSPKAKDRVICGFSMAGLLAFMLTWQAPDVFSRGIAMSPSFWFHDRFNVSAYKLVEEDCERIKHGDIRSPVAQPHGSGDVSSSSTDSGFSQRAAGDPLEISSPCFADIIASREQAGADDLLLYIDSGDGAGDNRNEVFWMNEALNKSGILQKEKDFVYRLDECADKVPFGNTHCQAVACARIHKALRLLLPVDREVVC